MTDPDAANGHHRLATWLVSQGFDPTDPVSPGPHGNTPLMQAAWRGAREIVEQLLARQVPLAATNGDGNNALWLACVHGDCGLIRRLVAAGVPIDHANLTGATALMYAASSGKAAVVAELLALGADSRLQSQDDWRALDMAANLACLRLLREAERLPPGPRR
jgi:ankyrin repeat protein